MINTFDGRDANPKKYILTKSSEKDPHLHLDKGYNRNNMVQSV